MSKKIIAKNLLCIVICYIFAANNNANILKNTIMLSLKDRKELKKNLRHGSVKKISEDLKCTPGLVSHWFNSRHNSRRIENAVFEELLMQRKEREDKLKSVGLL